MGGTIPWAGNLYCGESELSSNMWALMVCSLLSTVDIIHLAASRACHLELEPSQ